MSQRNRMLSALVIALAILPTINTQAQVDRFYGEPVELTSNFIWQRE